jgi:trehalose 6-phosphate phosphatase
MEYFLMTALDLSPILTRRPLGLIFDLDGTLSLMPSTPEYGCLWPGVAEDLERAKQYAHVAILSGREVQGSAGVVKIAGLTYIGVHGLQWCSDLPTIQTPYLLPEAQPYAEPGAQLFELLEQHLADFPGVLLQPKSIGGSIFYGQAAEPEKTRARLLTLLEEPARRLGMRIDETRLIIEILAPLAIDKGVALRRYVQQHGLQAVCFAGDDRNDLAAVLEIERLRQEGLAACSIVVQHANTPPALLEHGDVVVDDIAGMAAQLHEMVEILEKQAVRVS